LCNIGHKGQLTNPSVVKDFESKKKLALRSLSPAFTVAIAVTVIGSRFFLLMWKYSVNVLLWDQWDLYGAFFRGNPGVVQLFTWQHGPHREGLGLIPDRFLFPLTRWNLRIDSLIIAICIFAAMLLALMLKRKLFGPLSHFDVAIPLLFLTLNQAETLIGAQNPAYAGFPLLLIILYCHALLLTNRLFKYGFVLLLNFLLIFTGFGFFMGPITLGVFALESYRSARRWTSVPLGLPLTGLFVAAVSLGSFFIHYRFWPAVDCFAWPNHHVWSYPWFVAIVFSRFVIGIKGLTVATMVGIPIALAAITLTGVYLWRLLADETAGGRQWIPLILLSYSLLFAANCAIGRVCLGLPLGAQSARYVSLMIPAFLAMYFWLLSLAPGIKRTAALVIFTVAIAPMSLYKSQQFVWYAGIKHYWSKCYLRHENIQYCNEAVGIPLYPDIGSGRAAFEQKLDFLKRQHLNFFANAREEDQNNRSLSRTPTH
jgi:hypothetical protein